MSQKFPFGRRCKDQLAMRPVALVSLFLLGSAAIIESWVTLGGGSGDDPTSDPQPQAQLDTPLEPYPPAFLARFPDAPKPVLDIAATLNAGDTPSAEAIQALGPDLLNQSYVSPEFKKDFSWMRHSLLREAVLAANSEGARALMAAGADPFFNRGEMPFKAARIRSGGHFLSFPDYTDANAMIAMWLDAGGDPNATWERNGLLLDSLTEANLEGVFLLLERGADPWKKVPFGQSFGDTPPMMSWPFHLSNANANARACEVTFRIAEAGLYKGGSAEDLAELDMRYDRVAVQYLGSTGERNLHKVWLLQMATSAVYESLGREPPPAVSKLLAMDIPDGIGGFWLAPGELRSPDDPDQVVNNNNQWGNEMWNER